MHSDESIMLFAKLYKQISSKWPKFIESLKRKANQDDQSQIYFSDFIHSM